MSCNKSISSILITLICGLFFSASLGAQEKLTIKSNSSEFDLEAREWLYSGNVRITSPDFSLNAERVTVRLKKTLKAQNVAVKEILASGNPLSLNGRFYSTDIKEGAETIPVLLQAKNLRIKSPTTPEKRSLTFDTDVDARWQLPEYDYHLTANTLKIDRIENQSFNLTATGRYLVLHEYTSLGLSPELQYLAKEATENVAPERKLEAGQLHFDASTQVMRLNNPAIVHKTPQRIEASAIRYDLKTGAMQIESHDQNVIRANMVLQDLLTTP